MSLLLDALKRAEQEKHTRNGERPPAPPRDAVALAPAAANSPTGALELQPLGGVQAAPPPPSARSEAAAHAAQTVFLAKTAREDPAAGRGMLWATVGVIIIVVAAAGAYVWYSLRMLTPQLVAANAVRPPAAPTPPPASAGMTIGELPANGASPVPGGGTLPPPNVPTAPPPPAASRPDGTQRGLANELFKDPPAAIAPPPAEPEPLLARTRDAAPRVPADLTRGYDALRNGDTGTARRAYQAALERDPRSADAQLGMATLEARAGNRPAAAGHYRRVLEGDPQNATALAGLASVMDSRAENLEGLLREDIARQPQSGPLHLALGNVYAAQGRWHDAQAAYFEAHRLDPANADIAYNLAISLDRIGQPKLAAEQYRRALEAARGQAVQFEAAQVERRLAEIAAR